MSNWHEYWHGPDSYQREVDDHNRRAEAEYRRQNEAAVRKSIRVFWSPLSRRFYATRAWKEVSPGVVECTGERFDVTDDIASIIEREGIEFRRVDTGTTED